jgi:hypothetical protein
MRLCTKADKPSWGRRAGNHSLLRPEAGIMLGFLNSVSSDSQFPFPCQSP